MADGENNHPVDNENLAVMYEKAHKTGRWLSAVFVVDNGKIVCQVVTNDFPQADFDTVKRLFDKNVDDCREYKVSTVGSGNAPAKNPGGVPEGIEIPHDAASRMRQLAGREEDGEEMADGHEEAGSQVAVPGNFPVDALRNMRQKRR